MLRIISFLVVFLCLAACREERHFITDTAYRRTVEEDFEHKKQLLSGSQEDLFLIFNQPLTLEEREALEFIYAYAPLTDLATYGGDFLLKNVRQSLKVRAEMPWGKEIPEAIFRHFVLPVRGHNEGLDSSRFVFYRELRERVLSCKTMEEAALEVNHWCHEKAIYQPTNGRTCAPLTMTTTAYGRCGEESVFALAAMRSVGIPARQVYTPRWAHCDDNHAWIEVWTDGQWKYLGACEPEPRLDIAWFTAPVRRGLYIEARVFGKYKSDEEITAMNANLTAVNVTSHYTDVKKAVIRVVDSAGRPVEGASVEYKIYNYGEYYPAVTLTTDKQGISSLTVGRGDWIIWASKDGKFGFGELEAAHRDTLKIVMDKGGNEKEQYAYHIIPPVEKEYQALVKDEERAENDRRFMREDSIRNAYIATFMTEDAAQEKAKAWGYPFKSFFRYIQAARGNYAVVLRFLEGESGKGEERKAVAMELLDVLPEKDLQDITVDILEDQLEGAFVYASHPRCPEYKTREYRNLYREYILNPRIKNEFISAYRKVLSAYLNRESIRTPEELLWKMEEIKVLDSINTINILTPPAGVLKTMITDTRSKEQFFVAACRTMGIAARLNPVDGKPEYRVDDHWKPVSFVAQQTAGPKGELMVVYKGKAVKDPAYYTHFTLSRIKDGKARLLDLGSNAQVDMGGGATYSTIFRSPVALEEGSYILVSGNRKSDGSVLSNMLTFQIKAGKCTRVNLVLQEVQETLTVLGDIDTRVKYIPEGKEKPVRIELPRKGYTALALIGVNQEPTNHLIRDMSGMKADFEAKGIPMVFLFPDLPQLEKFSRSDFRPLPVNMHIGYDYQGKVAGMLKERLGIKNGDNLPIIVMVNKKGEVVFLSQGYRVGLGNQILRFMNL
ncbi:MAG: transglutaminase domain-containing protein [Odoribacter sp.]|nr:transglutaminase domain-containing protein [Odoribacter sp.]